MVNTCLQFDGVDDYVNCGNDVSLKPIDGLTLEAWVYFKSNTARQTIIDDSSYDAYSLIVYHGSPGTLRFWLNYHGGDMDTTVPSLNEWHHVVATYDRTLASANMKIYIDAVFVKGRNSTTVLPQTASNVYIGYTTWGSGYSFDGLIDEVRIYNRALSAAEVKASYQGQTVDTTGLVGEWLMQEGSGSEIADTSGEENTGTIYGAGWYTIPPRIKGVQSMTGVQSITF